jgi:hypothetical protein
LKTITNQEKDRKQTIIKRISVIFNIYKNKTILKWLKLKNKNNPKKIKIIKRRRTAIRRKILME